MLRALLAGNSGMRASDVAAVELADLEEIPAPTAARTLLEALDWHVRAHPQRTHVQLYGDTGEARSISYQDLLDGARAVAAGLGRLDVAPGQCVAIMLPTGAEYLHSFMGILLAGAIPVPIYPPARLSQIEDHFHRHARILKNAGVVCLITFAPVKQVSRLLTSHVPGLTRIVTVPELARAGLLDEVSTAAPDAVAFIQYTSGSTGNPKGVVLTHADLLASLRSMGDVLEVRSADVFVSWLPLYHDMGLIGAWLGSLVHGFPLVLMSPLTFLARPERWLKAIHSHRGTLSGGPNFAYELCLRRIRDSDIEGLDLSSWRLAFNGAEPVSPETVEKFIRRFGPYGLRADAMTPVYGLAEATLGVAFTPVGRGMRTERVRRQPMVTDGRVVLADADDADVQVFVSSGVPIPASRFVSSTRPSVKPRSGPRVVWSFAVYPPPAATTGIRRRLGRCFTTIGWTRGIALMWPTARFTSQVVPRMSSFVPGAISIPTSWSRPSPKSTVYAGVVWRSSVAATPAPAPSG